MAVKADRQKVIVIGAGPVGALSALYAAKRGDDVHVYEMRDGTYWSRVVISCFHIQVSFVHFLSVADPSYDVLVFVVVLQHLPNDFLKFQSLFSSTKKNPCYGIHSIKFKRLTTLDNC